DQEVPALGLDLRDVRLPLGDARHDAVAAGSEECRLDDGHPERRSAWILGIAYVCDHHRARPDLVLRREHDRLQLLLLEAALRLRTGAADAGAARPGEREDDSTRVRDPD